MTTRITLASISASLLFGCATTPPSLTSTEQITYTQSQPYQKGTQILKHCEIMASFGSSYQNHRLGGNDKTVSFDTAKKYLVMKYNLESSDKLDTLLIGYSAFIEMAPGYKANTMKYYTLSQCLTLHGLQQRLPLDRGPKEQKIKDVLKSCETTSVDDDHLGACILNRLRPMAEPF